MSSSAGGGDRVAVGRVALVALFVTALVTAQLTATKLLSIPFPVALPGIGPQIILPGAALAYAVTFFASDCHAELYGRRPTQVVVNVAFAMNFVVLALLGSTLAAPALDPEFASTFEAALAPGVNVIAGSLLAYVVSQNWDVYAFDRLREYTDGDALWLRNVGSTATSQALDTVIFVTVAFYAAPRLFGVGPAFEVPTVIGLLVGQYLLKLAVAVVDTPFVYAVVGYLRDREDAVAADAGV
jgi:uncharacterized integral membrane protein (TIGR00697 family)